METYSSRLNDLCSTFSPLKVVLSLKDDLMNVEFCTEIVILNIISSLKIAATVVTSCWTSCSELHISAVFLSKTRIFVKKNLKNCAELYIVSNRSQNHNHCIQHPLPTTQGLPLFITTWLCFDRKDA